MAQWLPLSILDEKVPGSISGRTNLDSELYCISSGLGVLGSPQSEFHFSDTDSAGISLDCEQVWSTKKQKRNEVKGQVALIGNRQTFKLLSVICF